MSTRSIGLALLLAVLPASQLLAAVDLRVGPENLVLRPAGPYDENQSVVIDFAARNLGDSDADALLKLECVETGQILFSQRLSFPANLFNSGQKGWIVPRAGTLTLRLSVNADRAVAETDYADNVVEKRITVRGPTPPPAPPLEIARVNVLPETLTPGGPLLIQAEVRNASDREQLFGVFVFFRRPGASSDSLATFSQHQTLQGGRGRVIDMRWQAPSFSPVPIRIEVQQSGKAVASVSRTLTVETTDLSIRRFAITPKLPDESTEPRLDVTIGNSGPTVCKVWLIAREARGNEVGRKLVTLPARGEAVGTLTLPRRQAGRYELQLELNSGLAGATPIREARLDNNRARLFWVVQAAARGELGRVIVADARDYEIWSRCRAERGEAACRELHPADDVQVDEPLAFEIQIWNRGAGQARFSGTIAVRPAGSPDAGSPIAGFDSGVLAPGRSDVSYARWTPRRTGRFELVFTLGGGERASTLVRPLRVHHRLETGVLYIGQRQRLAFAPAAFAKQSWREHQRSRTSGQAVRFKVWESTRGAERSTPVSWLGGVAYTTFEVRAGELGERRGRADLAINLALLGFMEHVDPEVPLVGLAIGASDFDFQAQVRLYHSPGSGALSRSSVLLAERPLIEASVERDWAAEFLWGVIDIRGIKDKADALGELVFVDQVVPWRGYVTLKDVRLEAGRRYNVAVYFRAECRANGIGARAEINFMDRTKVGDEEGRQLWPGDDRGIFFNHMEATWKP